MVGERMLLVGDALPGAGPQDDGGRARLGDQRGVRDVLRDAVIAGHRAPDRGQGRTTA